MPCAVFVLIQCVQWIVLTFVLKPAVAAPRVIGVLAILFNNFKLLQQYYTKGLASIGEAKEIGAKVVVGWKEFSDNGTPD